MKNMKYAKPLAEGLAQSKHSQNDSMKQMKSNNKRQGEKNIFLWSF